MYGRQRLILAAASLLPIAGCGGVSIAPEAKLPRALIRPVEAKVGYVIDGEQIGRAHV